MRGRTRWGRFWIWCRAGHPRPPGTTLLDLVRHFRAGFPLAGDFELTSTPAPTRPGTIVFTAAGIDDWRDALQPRPRSRSETR